MSRIFRALVLVTAACIFSGASMHHGTTIDPITQTILVQLPDGQVRISVEGPGSLLEKDAQGRLKMVRAINLDDVVVATFYSEMRHGSEQVKTFQRFRDFDGKLLLHGACYSYNPEGQLLTESRWVAGQLHGEQRRYDDAGQLVEETLYDEGLPVGTWKQYYASGVVASEITFPQSKTLWEAYRHNESSATAATIYSLPSETSFDTMERWYDQYGRLLREAAYQMYQEGNQVIAVPAGKIVAYDSGGNVWRNTEMQNGSGTDTYHRKHNGRSYAASSYWLNGHLLLRSTSSEVRE